jgi:hypothetical protein
VNSIDFESLATFRYQVRRFLRFSKDLLSSEDLTPDQYQALLAIRAFSANGKLSIRDLAEQLQVRHHSTTTAGRFCLPLRRKGRNWSSVWRRRITRS